MASRGPINFSHRTLLLGLFRYLDKVEQEHALLRIFPFPLSKPLTPSILFVRRRPMTSTGGPQAFRVLGPLGTFSVCNKCVLGFARVVSDAGGTLWREMERSNRWSSKLGV